MQFEEVVKRLRKNGWVEKLPKKKGSHRQFVHPDKPGKVAVPQHKDKDLSRATLKNIEDMTGVKLL